MKRFGFILLTALFFLRCDKDICNDTSIDTYHDPIGDVTYLHGYFFTTNNDASIHAGHQIYLYKFAGDGRFVEAVYDLGMNGQGYMPVANDGRNLFLQSRPFNQIYKFSPVGEPVYATESLMGSEWRGSGVCYLTDRDSLFVMCRNVRSPGRYLARVCSGDNPVLFGREVEMDWPPFSKPISDVLAVDYRGGTFMLLVADSCMRKAIVPMDWNFRLGEIRTLVDSTAVGLCYTDDGLCVAYEDRRIEKWVP